MKKDNKNELMDKWFEFRSEDIETIICDEDRDNMFSFQDALDVILKFVLDDKKYDVRKLIDEYDEKYCVTYNYWVKKYYMVGWSNSLGLLNL